MGEKLMNLLIDLFAEQEGVTITQKEEEWKKVS